MNILPIDELNTLKTNLNERFPDGVLPQGNLVEEDFTLDEMLDLLLLAYASGVESANAELGTSKRPSAEDAKNAVFAVVAGKTWEDRVKEYTRQGGSVYDIERIAETDMTRIYNTAKLDTVRVNQLENSVFKRWDTMLDDRVRDTHDYLEAVVVPYDADFYSFDGDHARAPGLFSLPENNINCRCQIELIRSDNV